MPPDLADEAKSFKAEIHRSKRGETSQIKVWKNHRPISTNRMGERGNVGGTLSKHRARLSANNFLSNNEEVSIEVGVAPRCCRNYRSICTCQGLVSIQVMPCISTESLCWFSSLSGCDEQGMCSQRCRLAAQMKAAWHYDDILCILGGGVQWVTCVAGSWLQLSIEIGFNKNHMSYFLTRLDI